MSENFAISGGILITIELPDFVTLTSFSNPKIPRFLTSFSISLIISLSRYSALHSLQISHFLTPKSIPKNSTSQQEFMSCPPHLHFIFSIISPQSNLFYFYCYRVDFFNVPIHLFVKNYLKMTVECSYEAGLMLINPFSGSYSSLNFLERKASKPHPFYCMF